MNLYLKLFFLLVVFLHVALLKLTVVLPVRTIALFAFFGLLFVIHHRQTVDFIKRSPLIFLTLGILAFLGGSLAFLQGEQLFTLAEYFVRNTVQPLLIFLCVFMAIKVLGINFVAKSFLAIAAFSAVVAIFQFAGIDFAWDVRRMFGAIQGDPPDIKEILRRESRPMGIVFTPILFSYHLISAYVIAYLMYRHDLLQPRLYAIFVLITLLASAASGTRSLVLGVLVHEGMQLALRGQLKSYIWLLVMTAVAAGGYLYLETLGSRVVSVEDSSAVSRVVLFKFGVQLFLANPFGFGWGVDPGEHAWLFWEELSHLPKASAVFRLGIHNAFINFLLQYGIFGLATLIVLAVLDLSRAIALFTAFLAYFINAMFHNAGVFVGDLYFWFAFTIFLYLHEFGDRSASDTYSRKPQLAR